MNSWKVLTPSDTHGLLVREGALTNQTALLVAPGEIQFLDIHSDERSNEPVPDAIGDIVDLLPL
jgi:hypothetical protein